MSIGVNVLASEAYNRAVLTIVGEDGSGDGGAIAVLNAERTRLGLAGLRRSRGISVLARAARALRRVGDPEIRRASVEVDNELLLVGADGNGSGPLSVAVLVGQSLVLTLGEVRGEDSERPDSGTLVESLFAAVRLEVDQVLTVLARGVDDMVSLPVF